MKKTNETALDLPRKKAAASYGTSRPHANTAAPDTDEAALDLGAIWSTLKRGKWIILATCVLVAAAFGGYTLTLPPVYESSAIVSVDPSPTQQRVINFGAAPDLANEVGILENSGQLSHRVIRRLYAIDDTSAAAFPLFRPEDGVPVDTLVAIERMREVVDFNANDEQMMIKITATSELPAEAAAIANVFAHEYRQFSREMARVGVVAARKFLEDQLAKRREDIRQLEDEWATFARSNQLVTQGPDGQRVAQEYVDLTTQRQELVFQLEQEQRKLTVMQEQLAQLQPNLRASVRDEQEAASLRTQIQALEQQIASLKAQAEPYYINDPTLRGNEGRVPELAELVRRVKGFEQRRAALTDRLVAHAANAPNSVQAGAAIGQVGLLRTQIEEQELTIGQLRAQIRTLDERIANFRGRIQSIPQQTVQREQLERRLAQAEQFYKDIAMELQRTIIAEESELGYVQMVRAAIVPTLPVSPNMQQNIILGILLGLVLGIGLAFVRQAMNWRIYNPEDIMQHGFSLVGVIPRMDREIKESFKGNESVKVDGRDVSTRLFPILNPWSPVTENYRLVRTNLKFTNGSKQAPQVLMVTSPEPSDGKTTTAVNIALTIALSGRRVLLIDADMRRPNAHKLLGVSRSPGLAEMLSGAEDVEIVQKTFVDGLYFVPAGTVNHPPTEMLDSPRMRRLLAMGRERCDVVIVDTPPILAASDPLIIGDLCDATLMIASAEKTDLRALRQVRETLDGVGIKIAGVIFNRYDADKGDGAYQYGYSYDQKYAYAPEEA
ncbi:polysaccharide biosynthesis tyrosine autokinase [Salisaeta longa]|uniref:polysaccharide biosynthesis tyrosine autokinase n=1 Tax=Salisaeta longa TaxID=503170 RepID=UPI0003B6817F|nr:polysaccharide biosynthesis tyrosine autokinase [Salisaeta longa]